MPNIHIWKRGHWTYITVIALQLLITFTRELKCLPGAKSRRTWLILFLKKRLTGRGENIWYRFTDIIFLWATRLRKMNPWNLNRIDTNTKRIFYTIQESHLTWIHLRRVGVYLYMYRIIFLTIFYRWCLLFSYITEPN